jgi:hypothetical protein
VKIILEIKFKNWCELKKCICGGADFKNCNPVECADCEDVYCKNQKGIKEWVWDCSNCWGSYCGEHEFKVDRIGKRVCFYCISPEDYKIDKKYKKKKLAGLKVGLLEQAYYRKRKVWHDEIWEISE